MSKRKKFLLEEDQIPTQWYNIQADMPNKPLPPLNPATRKPLSAEDLAHIFNEECSRQELDQEHAWIDIPEEVQDKYRYYRSTPLVRAYALEKALDTPAHIYFKNESVNPLGSHKINSALPQCYYCKLEGTTNVTTETGAGQWGCCLELCRQRVWSVGSCLSGEDLHASKALPQQHHAHVWCRGYRLTVNVDPCRQGHHNP